MKKLLVTLAAVLVSVSTFAQGTVNFNNRITPSINAPVYQPDGITGAGPSINAQLFLVSGDSFTAIGQATTFREPTAANPLLAAYVNPISSMIVDGHAPGSQISVVLRAWEGPSYESSLLRGQSDDITITLGGEVEGQPPAVAAQLAGLQGFNLEIIPEPSTIALGVLGAAALLYRRRN